MRTGTILTIAIAAVLLVVGVFVVSGVSSDDRALPVFSIERGSTSDETGGQGHLETPAMNPPVPPMDNTQLEREEVASN